MVESQNCFEIKEVGKNLGKEHSVFNLMYLIDLFAEFYPKKFVVKRRKKGRPSKYNVKELLTFILWAKLNDKESSRKLEEWCNNNDETCQLVLNCKKPCKTTILKFKNNNTELIDKFDQFLIDFAKELELIGGKILYADGTILKAWCNGFKSMYAYEIEYLKKFLTNNVSNEELWSKLQRYYIDEEEDDELKDELQELIQEFEYNLNSSGIYLLKLSLKSSTSFQKVLERIQTMEENITGKNSVSIIDPETRHMKDKNGKMGLNYNYQTVTDNKYGFRITHYITNSSNDQQELTKIVELTTKRLHTDDFIICFDNGYWNPEQIKEVLKGNTMVVIPDDADARRKKKKIQQKNSSGKREEIKEMQKNKKKQKKNKSKRIQKYQFRYIGDIDAFECPKTKELLKFVKIVTISGEKKKQYSNDYCLNCQFKKECTSQHKRLLYELYDKDIEKVRRFYYSKEGQEIYYQRGHFAETSFGILLTSRNFRGLKTRGIKKTNDELTLCEIEHNLKKFEDLTANKFLKLILNKIKEHKKENKKVDFSFIHQFKGKFMKNDDVIIGIREDKH